MDLERRTAALLDLPIEKALPEAPPRFGRGGQGGPANEAQVPASEIDQTLKDAFTSPARLSLPSTLAR